METERTGLHPLAVAVGVVCILVLIVVVTASSYRKQQVQLMARQLINSKNSPFASDPKAQNTASALPGFARNAAESGNTRVIKRWVTSPHTDVDACSNTNLTALHYATKNGHNDCVRLLLQSHADPNRQTPQYHTPLHLAALGGHAVSLKQLLDNNADPFLEDGEGNTPLDLAEKADNVGCARLLQRAMAKAAVQEDVGGKSETKLRASRAENAV